MDIWPIAFPIAWVNIRMPFILPFSLSPSFVVALALLLWQGYKFMSIVRA